MKIFLDTANIKEIREAHGWGILDGVTTNPSLVAKEGQDFYDVLRQICAIVQGPVSAEVVSITADEMVREGRDLARVAKNIVVKIPMIREGLKAIRTLSSEGIRVNTTLIFPPPRRSWRRRPAPPSSVPSSGAWMTSATWAWRSCGRSAPSSTTTRSSAKS